MKRMKRLCVVGGISIMVTLLPGCTNKVGMELRDAAISAASTFVEQQTLELLVGAFGSGTEP